MALTNGEKIKVLKYLGWPSKTIDSTSLSYSKIVSDRLAVTDEDILLETRYMLERFEKLEGRLETALDRAGVKSIDDIELNGDEMMILRNEKRRLSNELGQLLDIAVLLKGNAQGCVVV